MDPLDSKAAGKDPSGAYLESSKVVGPPWELRGRGLMFLYYFDRGCAGLPHFVPKERHGEYRGGLGALMLVDYQESNVGPYKEILFIPGTFAMAAAARHAISRIWVSSEASLVSGRANWGIPKDLAHFEIHSQARGHERWTVSEPGGKPFFQVDVSYGRLCLPLHTAMIPMPLLQTWRGKRFFTRFRGFGLGHLAHIQSMMVDEEVFPPLGNNKPLIGVQVNPFRLTIPVPEVSCVIA